MGDRILVVDDSPTIRKVVAAILERGAYETLLAENGEDALRQLRRRKVDLVLLDFVMPKMNGYQFCREIQADAELSQLPVVLMSAKGDKIRGQFVKQTGAADAITKPFDPLGLLAVVESALSKRRGGGGDGPDSDEGPDAEDRASLELFPEELELSEDPGQRREELAQHFASGVAKVVTPFLLRIPGMPAGSDDRIADALRRAITPERMGSLSALLNLLDFGEETRNVLSGDLSFISIAEILQLLELQRQTGALTVTMGQSEITLYVRQGLVDLARGRGMPLSFRLGRCLVQRGLLSRAQLREHLRDHGSSKRLIGDALVQRGVLTEEQVQQGLTVQTQELIYELVRWRSGRFTFTREASCPEATLAQLSLPPGGMVMEGFRRVDEWQLIEGSFDFGEVLQRDPAAASKSGLTDVEQTVLGAIDGKKTVREIVDEVEASTFDVCKILHHFLKSRLVRRQAA